MREGWRKLRDLRWRLWVLLGMAALTWWWYAAPIHLVKRIRSHVEEPLESGASSLVSSRVDFARVNARLSGDLHSASRGHLDRDSFSHLLLYGWLPQQRQNAAVEKKSRLYVVRYQDLNRFIAIFWDASEVHEVVLTLQRKSALHRWYVTAVTQFNVCAYDFDCAEGSIAHYGSTG
jgi:hypothetical protein